MKNKTTKTIACVLAGLMLSATSQSAIAQSFPRYNVETHCKEFVEKAGGHNSLYRGCINLQQSNYNRLQSIWSSLPSKTKSHCLAFVQKADGNYSLLAGCINLQSQPTPSFEY
ncbi:MAG: hypothetical protein K8953_04045 [Proteobacteria bacterium]|nr:hypothetical protein [Pseudomonadota bacterium]